MRAPSSSGEASGNDKSKLDALQARKAEITEAHGNAELKWHRNDETAHSRIETYWSGRTPDPENDAEELTTWGVAALRRLRNATRTLVPKK